MFWEDLMWGICCFIGTVFLFGLCAFALCCIFGLPMAISDCKLYNDKFGTHYTTGQFFWSGETIKSFLNQGEQKTYNLNIK
jgi:hypothetical protein